ncbi:alanine racemase [Leucobacter luti]|nr:alanine racemase [Leucobacter luti]
MPHFMSELVVHDDAIRENTATFARLTRGRLMAVLKADAFGHGAIAHSVLEAGANSIGVTSISEALALRADGVTAPILSWLNTIDADFASAVQAGIALAVPSAAVLFAVASASRATGTQAVIHLHVDAGMARDGCPARDWAALCSLAREQEATGAVRVIGIMGHMSCADSPLNPQNTRERLVFEAAVRTAIRRGLTPRIRHLAATAATLTGVGANFELHRIGAGLFGIDPSDSGTRLRPALTLTARVISSRELPAGAGVGYGLDFVAGQRTNLAVVPLGYGDGIPRDASGRAEVFARGRRRAIVGKISMDMIVVDTGADVLHPNESVTLFGPGDRGEPTVAEWAAWAHTIAHEIVTRVGSRVSRIHRVADTVNASEQDAA